VTRSRPRAARLARSGRRTAAMVLTLITVLLSELLFVQTHANATSPVAAVDLASAASYAVLGATGVTNTGATTLAGDLGVSPSSSIVGFPPGTLTGREHAGDPQAALAQSDLAVAYADAASRTPIGSFAGDLNGLTFTPGVYHSAAAMALTGTLTLDAQGNPDAVFIFQVAAALNTAAASQINLTGGALASQVFWQVQGAAGTGAASTFAGTILAAGAITIGAGGAVTGRALSMGAVTLATNTFTAPTVPGSLSISLPADAGNLANTPNAVDGEVISGQLGQVQVTDTRDALAGSGWIASVSATDFRSASGPSIPATHISYTAGPITTTGTVVCTADDPTDLTSLVAAVTATEINGSNTATWNPTITVTISGGTAAGVYTAAITHSVI
jgi:Ice-binding-like